MPRKTAQTVLKRSGAPPSIPLPSKSRPKKAKIPLPHTASENIRKTDALPKASENAQSSGNFGGSGQNAGQYGGQSAAEPGNGQNPAQNNGQNTAGGAAYGQYTPPRQNYYGGPYYGQRGQYGGYYRPNTPPPPYGYNRYPYGQY